MTAQHTHAAKEHFTASKIKIFQPNKSQRKRQQFTEITKLRMVCLHVPNN